MKIKLRGTRTAAPAPASASAGAPRVGHRQFLKALLGAAGIAGLAQAATPVQTVSALYTPGGSFDSIDHGLTIAGNLGVGSATTPTAHLQITAADTAVTLGLQRTGQDQNNLLQFVTTSGGAGDWLFGQRNLWDSDLHFFSYGMGGVDVMLVKRDTGYVGIGTAIPLARLDVAGDMRVSTSLTVGAAATIAGNLGVGTTTPAAHLQVKANDVLPTIGLERGDQSANNMLLFRTVTRHDEPGSDEWLLGERNGNGSGNVNTNSDFFNSDFHLYSFAFNGGMDALVVKRVSGYVGVGTTMPTCRLDVAGDIHGSGVMNIEGNMHSSGDFDAWGLLKGGHSLTLGTRVVADTGGCYYAP